MSFSKNGYLRLLWLPGKLHFQNDTYNLVTSKVKRYAKRGRQPKKTIKARLVSEPCNLFSDVTCHWKVTPEENHLEASILINDSSGKYNSPWIRKLSSRSRCTSESAGSLLRASQPLFWLWGLPNVDSAHEVDESSVSGLVKVIAVDGSEKLRIAALGMERASDPVVLRGNACLDCCIRACRLAGFSILVL
ncbi:hypothetical protein TrVFT333_006186 [Trichoderma virens FT-333]|nr:hypothetical protein TrVFT333_006186 [Trichoderma virens FT-333]